MLRTCNIATLMGLAVSFFAGCGPAAPSTYHITGNVSYEGEPVQEGTIVFYPQEPNGVEDTAPIKAGKYDAQVKKGKKKVVINALREEGEIDPAMGVRPRKPYLPPEYSVESMTKLQADVAADGTYDFELKKP